MLVPHRGAWTTALPAASVQKACPYRCYARPRLACDSTCHQRLATAARATARALQAIGSSTGPTRSVQAASSPDSAAATEDTGLSALDASRRLALARAQHSEQQQPLFVDPYAAALSEGGKYDAELSQTAESQGLHEEVVTAFLDQQLLTAVSLVNMELKKEYKQVALVGCGMDTRPFRLKWPPGTLLFLLAPSEVHAVAAHQLKEQGAKVPRGCLLRRVPVDLAAGESFQAALERSGFRGDRLSIWGLQGLGALNLEHAALHSLFTDIVNCAAFGSIVLGELPAMSRQLAENFLAEYSLLGSLIDMPDKEPASPSDVGAAVGTEASSNGTSSPANASTQTGDQALSTESAASTANSSQPASEAEVKAEEKAGPGPHWLFHTQHRKLSLQQMGIYSAHVEAAEETDEDFFDNFS